MLLRLRLLLLSFGGGMLFLLLLCLGAQNLSERQSHINAEWIPTQV